MRISVASLVALLALLAANSAPGASAAATAAPASAPAEAPADSEPLGCKYRGLITAKELPELQSWEFDLQLPDNKLSASQAELVTQVSADLQGLGLKPEPSKAETQAQSWLTYFLVDGTAAEGASSFGENSHTPFNSPGTLRFRKSIGEQKEIADRRRLLKKKDDTSADLRLKAKIDPATFSLEDGKKAKTETFGQQKCSGRKEFVSVKFKGVSPDLNISTPAGVEQYFPGLAQHFNLSSNTPLELNDEAFRSSTQWPCPTEAGAKVTCEVQINYPSAEAALAGKGGTVGQLIFSFKTADIKKGQLEATVQTLADVADEMTRKGWEAGPENDI
ncbi:hypothetical protein COHA_006686 [Chlorella ohadii]|uniref:Uncharacterized protein n=1 Tax=Chlorella ohadii TaxID=2649997 RepID=A0AAD5DNI2_9CHLO|nr:hypothetical protein COHA_006686 [Chlorella ohadii]